MKCLCGCNQEANCTNSYFMGHWNKGRILTEEHKQKIRIKNQGKPSGMLGKQTYYQSPLQGTVCFRSSYELAYAKYLDKNNILWLYELETFNLGNTTYTPDFFLPHFEKFIEIKGYLKERSKMKLSLFKEQYPFDLEILFKEDLQKLGVI